MPERYRLIRTNEPMQQENGETLRRHVFASDKDAVRDGFAEIYPDLAIHEVELIGNFSSDAACYHYLYGRYLQ
jgi:hypothetical protein